MSAGARKEDPIDRQEFLRTLTRWGLAGALAALGAALLGRTGPRTTGCVGAATCQSCRLHTWCFGSHREDGGTR